MQVYIALLRAINVGGKNKISMPALRAAFEAAGFTNVSTYINSGNVIFSAEETATSTLAQTCEAIIAETFSLSIAVTVISAPSLAMVIQNAPPWWGKDEESRHDAAFVLPPFTTEEILAAIGTIKPEYEQLGAYGSVIFWSAPKATFAKTQISKLPSTSAYRRVTIRNANTTKKLAELTQ